MLFLYVSAIIIIGCWLIDLFMAMFSFDTQQILLTPNKMRNREKQQNFGKK